MNIESFLRGVIIGLAMAAPVGPIGMLVIRRTLAEGRLLGLCTGLGAAVADACYGCVGAFGLTFISGFLLSHGHWTRLLGGIFLGYLGISTFLARPKQSDAGIPKGHYASAFLSTVLLTLANPVTILSFMAVFAGLGLGSQQGDYAGAAVVVAGVFLGSTLWWVLLSGGVALLRHRLKPGVMVWINRFSGASLLAFAGVALLGQHG